jgi:protein disulfide-isomerase
MKRSIFLPLLLLAAGAARAELRWTEDFDKAAARAREENKYVLVDFTGSDWCGWCKKLDR